MHVVGPRHTRKIYASFHIISASRSLKRDPCEKGPLPPNNMPISDFFSSAYLYGYGVSMGNYGEAPQKQQISGPVKMEDSAR